MRTAFELRQSDIALLSHGTQIWMRAMQFVFFASIAFIVWQKFARYVLLTAIVTAAVLIFGKALLPHVPLSLYGSITQLVLWLPLFTALVLKFNRIAQHIKSPVWHSKVYGIWLALLFCTITISLGLNIKYLLA